jgi:hypothetical protein
MNTALPARKDYYRVTRARELRRIAHGARIWIPRLLWLNLGALGVITGGVIYYGAPALRAFLSFLPPWVSALWLTSIGVLVGIRLLAGSIERSQVEAEALEAEHQARYGALPKGEEPQFVRSIAGASDHRPSGVQPILSEARSGEGARPDQGW